MSVTAERLGTTAALASFVECTGPEDVDDALADRVAQSFLDALANAAFARWQSDSARSLTEAFPLASSRGSAVVVGDRALWRSDVAALLNGALIHTLDFDDTNEAGVCHPSACVIPAALALAADAEMSGRSLLTAIAVGHEVACRIGAGLGLGAYDRGFHPTAIAGLFGAIATGSKLLELDGAQIEAAFGVASSLASGSMQYSANGAWNKRIQPGLAARNALLALDLARASFFAAAEPVEGVHGVLRAFSARPDRDVVTRDLGVRWMAEETTIKPYPTCRLTHGAIDAAVELRELRPASGTHGHVTVRISPLSYGVVGQPEPNKLRPTNSVEAQFSVYTQIAAVLVSGGPPTVSSDYFSNPAIVERSSTVEVVVDESLRGSGCVLEWVDSGDRVEVRKDVGSGPTSWATVEAKALSLLEAAYDSATCTSIIDYVTTIAGAPRVEPLLTELRNVRADVRADPIGVG